jgi:hypothetical protein
MGLLLLPLHGALFFVSLAAHLLVVVALIDAATQPEQGFIAADKQTGDQLLHHLRRRDRRDRLLRRRPP